mgnify:CR=1 FL=1
MESIETAAAAYVAARLNVLSLKRARTACRCEQASRLDTDASGFYVTPFVPRCSLRPEDEPCAPCVERAKINAQLPKAAAAARRRFVQLAALVKAAEHFGAYL